ncbi:MAG TPA: pimeloyl-ACP methyl ester esterase BioH [Gammaproteobacteria bacterium]
MLHYQTFGNGKPIYLLHGWALNGRVWDEVIPALAQHGQVIAVDLPGHGKSGLPAGGGYSLDAVSDEIKQILSGDAIIVGWSLGGLIALNLAQRYPALIEKLVLVAGSPQFIRSSDWPHAVDKQVMQGFAQSLADDYRATIQRFLAIQTLGSEQARPAIKALRGKMFIHGEPQLTALREGLNLLTNSNLRAQLPNIHCPALIVLGEKDTLVPANSGPDTARLLANARLAIIKGAGHAPFLSHASEFIGIISEFINESSRLTQRAN